MKQIVTNQTVKIPEGLTVTVKSRLVTVKGPRGILKRSFKHLALDIRVSRMLLLQNIYFFKEYFSSNLVILINTGVIVSVVMRIWIPLHFP